MTTTKTFDPELVQVIMAGVPLEGFTEDGFVDVEFTDVAFKYKRGVDGQITRSKVLGRMAVVTVHLQSSSRSNAVLTGIHVQDLLSNGGAGISPFMIKDGNGADLFVTDEAWIEGFPAMAVSAEAAPRDWKIICVSPKVVLGGI